MGRVLTGFWIGLVILWLMARLLNLGPVEGAIEIAVVWLGGGVAASAVIAALTVLGFGLIAGRTNPAWLRFIAQARTAAAVIGSGLVILGLLHYRDTEPRTDVSWLVAGVLVLVGAGIVHGWLSLTTRRT